MLHSGFDSVGIGHVYFNGIHYWVEEFAKAREISSPESEAIDVDGDVVLINHKSASNQRGSAQSCCNYNDLVNLNSLSYHHSNAYSYEA